MYQSTDRRVAIVGAGPAGLYALQAALALPSVARVDVFDMLPAPYGLVRYGVAADHAKTKSVIRVFHRLLEQERARFFGNVRIGEDLSRQELLQGYDAVIYATGARHDRALGISGEAFPGSHGAADFVSWYSGHPDSVLGDIVSGATSAVVVGAGNVALDVVRILAKEAHDLYDTDMPDDVVAILERSRLEDIHVLARRGPAQAKFTSVELRELGELPNTDIYVDGDDINLNEASDAAAGTPAEVMKNLRILHEWAQRVPEGRPRRIHLHFWTRPVSVQGHDRVRAVLTEDTRSGRRRRIDAQLVLRSIGYQPTPPAGLPFDVTRGVVPNVEGRVTSASGVVSPGEYVAGWLKRGPSGVIGTNRRDAAETVASLAEDLQNLETTPKAHPSVVERLLAQRNVRVVDWAAWKRLEAHEFSLGERRGTATVKVADRQAMLDICHGPAELG